MDGSFVWSADGAGVTSGLPWATDGAAEDDGTGIVPIGPLLLPQATTRTAIARTAPRRPRLEWLAVDRMDGASVAGFICPQPRPRRSQRDRHPVTNRSRAGRARWPGRHRSGSG